MVDPIPDFISEVGEHWVTVNLLEHSVQPVEGDSLLFLSTGEMWVDDNQISWSGAGGLDWDFGCNVEHSGQLPADFPVGKVKAVTFFLTDSLSNSFVRNPVQGPTRLKLILGDHVAVAASRPSVPGETAPLNLPWVIRFEFPEPVRVLPGEAWSLVDGDDNILSAALLHMSNLVSSENLESALPGTSEWVGPGCDYQFSETTWYSVKFELQ